MFYSGMKGMGQFNANFLSYIATKYCYNWSTSDLVIVKTRIVYYFQFLFKWTIFPQLIRIRPDHQKTLGIFGAGH